MRKRSLLVFAVLTAAMLVAGSAFAGGPVDKATGGGQTFVTNEDDEAVGGAGNTIAFNARRLNNTTGNFDAEGQVQYIKRSVNPKNGKGYGKDGDRYHGTVNCLEVTGDTARIAGTWTNRVGNFEIIVKDNPEPTDDAIFINANQPDPECGDDNNTTEPEVALARGNAQVYDAPASP